MRSLRVAPTGALGEGVWGTGIFFNHESQYRSRSFVARKISYNLARLKLFGRDPLRIGNLDSKRDWGNAEDFVKGMKMTLVFVIFVGDNLQVSMDTGCS